MSFKERCNKGKEKALKFYEDHKTGVKLGLAALGLVAVGGTAYAVGNYRANKVMENFTKSLPDKVQPDPEYDDSIPYECRKWKEEYRETYDKVCEFADTIDLEDGEVYIIARDIDFDEHQKEHILPVNFVSHLIDGDGVYPPDERDE